MPQSIYGPKTVSASGGIVPRNGLTTGYPVRGVAYGIPVRPAAAAGVGAGAGLAASRVSYPVGRPYYHT